MALRGEIFADEFANGQLADGWEWVDPRRDCSCRITPDNKLEITSPHGHDMWPACNYNAPRLIRPVEGDFILETRLTVQPRILFEGAGLFLWRNMDNFIRFDRGHRGEGDFPLAEGPEIGCSKEEDGTFLEVCREKCDLTTLLMRIVREGNHLSLQYGESGMTWRKLGSTTFDVRENLKAGVYVICSRYPDDTPGSLTATFDYIKIET